MALAFVPQLIAGGAQALRQTSGRDLFVMAAACLKAALRHEDDVYELLRPAKTAPATIAELRA